MPLSRRRFLLNASLSAALPLVLRTGAFADGDAADPFGHGVASGDPLADRVVLWTRVTPPSGMVRVPVRWRIADDERLTRVVVQGTVETLAERDFTVKVDATGLRPGRPYFFAFDALGARSPVGHTRTLAADGVERVRLAVVSCANYPAGYFNVYRALANRPDLDAVVHLGDYIYEFANGVYGDGTALGRVPVPSTEARTLADYRLRYATYRTDPDLQAAHQRHPFIAVWDDHESANNASATGAAGHQASEGDWAARLAAAYRAYLEWMPVRETPGAGIRLYRRLSFGTLADLVMLDTRGLRDRQVSASNAALGDPARTLLGADQESWVAGELRASQRRGARWRLLGQQVLFSSVTPPFVPVQNVDMWDGYPAARTRLLDAVGAAEVTNLAILTGDIHSSWAIDVPRNPWAGGGTSDARPVAVELVTPAISSPPLFSTASIRDTAPLLRLAAPHVKYLDGEARGYVLLDVTAARLQADWYHMATVSERRTDETRAASFVVESGSSRLAAG